MEVLFILIFVSVSIEMFFLILFIYSYKHGQFNDLYSPSVIILNKNKHEKT